MSMAIVWGAGKEGRGFLFDILLESGYDSVLLVDKDEYLIQQLNQQRSYHLVHAFPEGGEQTKVISISDAISCLDITLDLVSAVCRAETIALCVYPSEFDEAAHTISSCMLIGMEYCVPKNILLCVNKHSPASSFREAMCMGRTQKEYEWLMSNSALVQCLVHRTCVAFSMHRDDLSLLTNGYPELLVDEKALFHPLPKCKCFKLCPDMAFAEKRKLYTYNLVHAVYGYIGALKGYQFINESAADPIIFSQAQEAIGNICQAFILEYNIEKDEMRKYLEQMWRFAVHPILQDRIDRLCVDPIRKLSQSDRIIGPLLLCQKHGIRSDAILSTAKAALLYRDLQDPSSMRLHETVKQKGFKFCLYHFSGLKYSNPLMEAILQADT